MHNEIDSTNQFPNLLFILLCYKLHFQCFMHRNKRGGKREGKSASFGCQMNQLWEKQKERQTKEANQLKMCKSKIICTIYYAKTSAKWLFFTSGVQLPIYQFLPLELWMEVQFDKRRNCNWMLSLFDTEKVIKKDIFPFQLWLITNVSTNQNEEWE